MENKKIRISEAEYDAVCEYRKSLGKSFVPKELFKRGKGKSYRTRLCDEEFKIVNNIRSGNVSGKEIHVDSLIQKRKNEVNLQSYKNTIKKLVDEVSLLRERQGLVDGISDLHICEIKTPINKSHDL